MGDNDVVQLGCHVLCVTAELPYAMVFEACGALSDGDAQMVKPCHCVV